MNAIGNSTSEQNDEAFAAFDVGALLHLLRQKLWLIALCGLAGLALGVTYAALAPNMYKATAIVQVEEENPSVVAIQDVTKEDFRQPENLKTVEQRLCTPSLIWRVIQANKLDQIPGYFKPGLWHKLTGAPLTRSDMVDSFSACLVVKLRRGTRLIDIAVIQGDPKMARTLVQSLIDEYGNEMIEGRANPSKQANRFLAEEAERLKQKVETSEHALQEYREKNQAVSLEDKQNIVVERLKDLNMRVAKAQNDRVALESDVAQLSKFGREPEKLLAIGSIANAQSVLDVQKICTEKEASFAMLKQRYGAENPALVQAKREVEQVRSALNKAVLNAADSLHALYEAAKITQETSEKMLHEQEEQALALNRKSIEYSVLSREVDSDRALFDSVVKRMKETSIMQNISAAYLRLVEAPVLPDRPEMRKRLLAIALGLLGALFLGGAGVLGRQISRPSFQTVASVERVLRLPGLCTIPRTSGGKVALARLPAIKAPHSPAAEAFRFLATSVTIRDDGPNRPAVLFVSAQAKEGRTFCAASYAVALAQRGHSTLLIEADFRNPMLAQAFSLAGATGGLAGCLSGRGDLATLAQPAGVENLSLLPAGTPGADPSRLLDGPAFRNLLNEALSKYQRVVIDSAAAEKASETLLLAQESTAICLVIEANRTPISAAARVCQWLALADRTPLGFVLNKARR